MEFASTAKHRHASLPPGDGSTRMETVTSFGTLPARALFFQEQAESKSSEAHVSSQGGRRVAEERETASAPPRLSREVERSLNASITLINAKIACAEAARIGLHAIGLSVALPSLILHGTWIALGAVATLFAHGIYRLAALSAAESRFIKSLEYMSGASSGSRVEKILDQLSAVSGIKSPRALIIWSDAMNAGVIDNTLKSDVLFCSGALERVLDERQLKGVLAHELAHSNRSVVKLEAFDQLLWCMSAPSLLCGTCLGLMSFGTGVPVAAAVGAAVTLQVGSLLTQITGYIRRQTEFKTDLRAVAITGDPESLISALTILTGGAEDSRFTRTSFTHPSTLERATLIRQVCSTDESS